MNQIGVAESLAGSHIGDIELTGQSNRDILPGDLAQRSIVVDCYSVTLNNSLNSDIVFNNCEDLRAAKAVANNLRLRQAFTISPEDAHGWFYSGMGQQSGYKRTVVHAAELFRA